MASVLLVEHNRMLRTMYAAGLAGFGYQVHEANSLSEAYALLDRGLQPAVLITDWKLVDGSADELVHAVESAVGGSRVNIFIVTSHANEVTCNCDHILPKNTGIMEVLALL